jgi:hypothetical protein
MAGQQLSKVGGCTKLTHRHIAGRTRPPQPPKQQPRWTAAMLNERLHWSDEGEDCPQLQDVFRAPDR